jgi:cytochrome c oxidase accessory protein FixG
MSEKIPLRDISLDVVQSFHPDFTAKRQKIHTKLIHGFFQNIRNVSMYGLLALFVLLPWLRWDERQAILFDIPHRQFYVFGITFMPQDLFLLSWVFIMAAFVLFVVTVFGGRVFCGYSCPQTIWVNLFMRVEKLFEGERHQRARLDKAPMSASKLARRTGKHSVWLLIALATGLTFVSYFTPTEDLYHSWTPLLLWGHPFLVPNFGTWEWFFIGLFTIATYLNAGWMREQMCFHICPYGRFQSVMFDRDTLIVSYDIERGEPRGARKRTAPKDAQLGDCIDCDLCVQVCPTGIDIRDGLQMECIQCAACVDACDSVMDRMNYPRGLVRYTTERELVEHQKTHWLRPRLLGYAAVLLLMFGLFSWTLINRVPLQVESIRDRNQMYRINSDGFIENAFLLKITNKTQQEQAYKVSLNAANGLKLDVNNSTALLDAGEVYEMPVTVVGDPERVRRGEIPIVFRITGINQPELSATVENRFRAPSASERAKALRAEQEEQ